MRTLAASLLTLILVACAAAEEDAPSTAAPEVNAAAKPLPEGFEKVVAKLNDQCAANSNTGSSIRDFDVKTFDASKVMAEWKSEDKERGCPERFLSNSKESGVKMLRAHLADPTEDTKACVEENLTPQEKKMLDDVIGDPGNLAVFANEFGGGESEACLYFEYQVYRTDGKKLTFAFEYTD